MPNDEVYLLTGEQWDRLREVLNRVERQPLLNAGERQPFPSLTAEMQPVSVSDPATLVSGRYSGFVLEYDAEHNTYKNLDPCWVTEPNKFCLMPGKYIGRRSGILEQVPIFLVSIGCDCHFACPSPSGSEGTCVIFAGLLAPPFSFDCTVSDCLVFSGLLAPPFSFGCLPDCSAFGDVLAPPFGFACGSSGSGDTSFIFSLAPPFILT